MRILAVETSCDETAAAIINREPDSPFVSIERSIVASQAMLHEKYGGVFPEVASREHIRQILPVIAESLGLTPQTDGLPEVQFVGIDSFAVTNGPGLVGSLLIGTQTIATLSLATGIPLIAVNHLAGHIYASFIKHEASQSVPEFPLLSLVVSGGHTMLIRMTAHHSFELLGQTRDDAAGEAFDKVAKLLGLGYPGGPEVSRIAEKGDRHAYRFPIGLEKESTLDFSFSGLKTAVLRLVQQLPQPLTDEVKANIAASFELSVVESLLLRTSQALDDYPVRDFVLGGGVAANRYLRERLDTLLAHRVPSVKLFVPPINLCTDNAAVIGSAAAFDVTPPVNPVELQVHARLPLHN